MQISNERISKFLSGWDSQERIVNVELGYADKDVTIFYRDEDGNLKTSYDEFYPFIWSTQMGGGFLYQNNRVDLMNAMTYYGIGVKGLNIHNEKGETTDRMENGYRVLFYAKTPMTYSTFLSFFKKGGVDFYNNEIQKKHFLAVNPVEQYLIHSGKRFFKGYEDYDEILRAQFDIETTGLDATRDRINQIGVRTNRGKDHLIEVEGNTPEELRLSEIKAIKTFLYAIKKIDPDVISGHNSENFDWDFIIKRCELLNIDLKNLTQKIFGKGHSLYKKKRQTILKLGGEVEYFNQTVLYGKTITDSIHAVRRAQAIDSNMKKANLKYVTEYLKLKKPNRVYIPGDNINKLWISNANYAFKDEDGSWYEITDKNPLKENYEVVTGEYIVRRYLLDDLYETDKVELTLNQSNFLLTKILPTTFGRATTMGTAGTWKLLMLAWSYENEIAVPMLAERQTFTGGLSRLLKVGFVDDVVKLDFNSLYPSITLTWGISPDLDTTNVMLKLLGYILDQREYYKGLMGKAKGDKKTTQKELELLNEKLKNDSNNKELKKEINKLKRKLAKYDIEINSNDKKQLPFKIFANSFFGAFGAPYLYPWGDIASAENITSVGRQSLRLMVKWFGDRGFEAIVGDTDGFNFKIPKHARDYKYISSGENRNTTKDKEYFGVEAYIAEFNDLFMRGKMGLGLDELADSTLNFSRKNYADLLDNGSIKLVGNSIKSKMMPTFIEKFLDENIKLLLHSKGHEFINNYYNYIEKIYNGNIPLRDIASKGRIKKTISEYIADSKTFTKSGAPKARQAWYELVIQDKINVDLGDVVYYINTGTKKNEGDVKRVPIYKMDEDGKPLRQDKVDKVTGEILYTKTGKPRTERILDRHEIEINCVRIDNKIIEAQEDIFGHEPELFETPLIYNTSKYIEQFNNKINPLLICFHPDIREDILIDNPEDRRMFTEKETELVSGLPRKEDDQDTYEELMSLSDREIAFWIKKGETPVFTKELDMNWDVIVEDYKIRQELLKEENVRIEKEMFDEIVEATTKSDLEYYYENSVFKPNIIKDLSKFLTLNVNKKFISNKYNVVIGSIDDFLDKNIFEFIDDNY